MPKPLVVLSTLLASICAGAVLHAQSTQQSSPPQAPAVRRWLDIDTFTLYSRYHFVENGAHRTTSNQSQYKTALRARFNIDRQKRLTINTGLFTGATFISTWNSLGAGPGEFDGHHQYMKQLYVAAVPHSGWEAQYGSLYVRRGEEDEITSYDEDGYLIGERLGVKAPRARVLDELVLTRAEIGPFNEPNAFARWHDPSHANYGQVLATKRVNRSVAASLEYATQSGADTLHAGVTIHLPDRAPVATLRYEQYRRLTAHPAWGFSVWADRVVARRVRLQGGYASIDRWFGGWNADRIQIGSRVFGVIAVPLGQGFGLQVFATRAASATYPIPIASRVDVTLNYDVLSALKRAGWF